MPTTADPRPHTPEAPPTEHLGEPGCKPFLSPQNTCRLDRQIPRPPLVPLQGYKAGPVFHGEPHCSSCIRDSTTDLTLLSILCIKSAFQFQFGSGECSGRVELWHNGSWGTVCDDSWDLRDAQVVCRRLGCGTALEAHGNSAFGQGTGTIWLNEVNCRGDELHLWDCPHSLQEQRNCSHKEDAGVTCAESQRVRLQGSEKPCTGRVEVFYNGSWGVVCSQKWTKANEKVVCNMLRCGSPQNYTKGRSYSDLPNKMWMNNVECFGNETNLWNCVFPGWGISACSHTSDHVNVECSGSKVLPN
uniref:SRCR domain-containing protein n=1 Tax=Paramormyrops kingsleyae TaxID=1676925 RepID=A0A3B3T4U3_9TELE